MQHWTCRVGCWPLGVTIQPSDCIEFTCKHWTHFRRIKMRSLSTEMAPTSFTPVDLMNFIRPFLLSARHKMDYNVETPRAVPNYSTSLRKKSIWWPSTEMKILVNMTESWPSTRIGRKVNSENARLKPEMRENVMKTTRVLLGSWMLCYSGAYSTVRGRNNSSEATQ